MEVYLHSISERPALMNNEFQCMFPFFLIVCFNGVMEEGDEVVKACLQVFFHIECKGTN